MNQFFLVGCFLALIFLSSSCNTEPQAITYGEDECHRCKMIISDERFGAELITQKGKVYKYDAIECLIPIVLEYGENQYSHILVTDYDTPNKFIPAQEASFLISKQRPSPMGGFLSAYSTRETGNNALNKNAGEIYNWPAILKKLDYE